MIGHSGGELPGLTAACEAIAAGRAAVVPNAPPMTYGIVATSARLVNALKGRLGDQPVGVSLHDRAEWQGLAPSLDLPPACLDGVLALLEERLGLLLPLRADRPAPDWIEPAITAGSVGVFNGSWEPAEQLWQRFPRLFGSSANRSGLPPARSAAEARATFGSDCAVIDADALGGRRVASTTMIALDRHGRMTLSRSGAQDQTHDGPHAYLSRLADRVGLQLADPAEWG